MGSYIMHNLGLSVAMGRRVRTLFTTLRSARTVADYTPGWSCDREIALDARMTSEGILKEIGVA